MIVENSSLIHKAAFTSYNMKNNHIGFRKHRYTHPPLPSLEHKHATMWQGTLAGPNGGQEEAIFAEPQPDPGAQHQGN